ncbi:MAG: methyltransferase domain-containing protein [Elusimicrobia bacterium]|nr:methyltransferase domain-containing protein [Elusimicrobiota bacterium]
MHDAINQRKFEGFFKYRVDPYRYATLEFEQRRFQLMIQLLQDRFYAYALEVGCAEGFFTEKLVPICNKILALDVSEEALQRTRSRLENAPQVKLLKSHLRYWVPSEDERFDLIVLSEVLYYLGERNDLLRILGSSPERCVQPVLEKLLRYLSRQGRVLLAHSHAKGQRASRELYREILQGMGLRLIQEQEVNSTVEAGTDCCLVSLLEKK